MKPILQIMKKFFYISDDLTIPRRAILTMWIAWMLCVIVLFDIVLADEIMSLRSRITPLFACGMIVLLLSFHDESFVRMNLKKHCNNLLVYLYCGNLFCMAIEIALTSMGYWGEINSSFFVRQSVFMFFWFLSISLALVYNPWKWCIWAGFVFLASIGYHLFLQWYISRWNATTIPFLCLTIGGVLVAVIASYTICRNRINKLFREETTRSNI